jgi:hypothetical protein
MLRIYEKMPFYKLKFLQEITRNTSRESLKILFLLINLESQIRILRLNFQLNMGSTHQNSFLIKLDKFAFLIGSVSLKLSR